MQQIMLDEKWTFRRGMLDSIGMLEADPGKAVDLPHDGMISLSVSKEAAASVDSGYFPGDKDSFADPSGGWRFFCQNDPASVPGFLHE